MMHTSLLLGRWPLATLGLILPLSAQTAWVKLSPTTSPPPRTNHAMVFDGTSVILFGGQRPGGAGYLNDTWRFDGSGWQQVQTATSPPARGGHAMAYDPVRKVTVMFSGWNGGRYPRDTWEFDGTNWKAVTGTQPPERDWHQMAFEPITQKVVMFGGHDYRRHSNNGPGAWDDMWTYDGTNWTAVTSARLPPKRFGHAMVASPLLVVTGGVTPGVSYNDMWRFDGTNWNAVMPAQQAGQRNWPVVAFDSDRRRHVLHGGNPGPLTDSVEFDGRTWLTRLTTGGPSVSFTASAYDPVRAVTVAFGGTATGNRNVATADTWIYGAVRPGSIKPFGMGCRGSAGVLELSGDSAPYINDSFTLTLALRPSSGVGVFHIGASRTTWNGQSLPFSLASIGAPGCFLLVSPDIFLPGMNRGPRPTSTLTIPLPNNPSLIGQTVFAQGEVTDPSGNAAGVVFANGVEIQIGAK